MAFLTLSATRAQVQQAQLFLPAAVYTAQKQLLTAEHNSSESQIILTDDVIPIPAIFERKTFICEMEVMNILQKWVCRRLFYWSLRMEGEIRAAVARADLGTLESGSVFNRIKQHQLYCLTTDASNLLLQ